MWALFPTGVRRISRTVSSGTAVLLLLNAPAMGAEPVPDMKLQKVGPRIYCGEGLAALGSAVNQNFISNAGFVNA